MGGKDHDTRAKPGFVKRRTRMPGQFSGRLIDMLESPAWRVLSLSARRLLDRIEIELAHHGRNDNGRLPVTFEDFTEYGIHHNAIAPAIREAEALGFIRVTEHGRGGNAEYRRPNKFFLTYTRDRGSLVNPPTDDWGKIKTIKEAEAIARAARQNKDPRAAKFAERRAKKTENQYRKPVAVPHPETGSEIGKSPHPETGITVSPPKPVLLSISRPGGARVSSGSDSSPRYPIAKPTQPYNGYSSLPIELRMLALGYFQSSNEKPKLRS